MIKSISQPSYYRNASHFPSDYREVLRDGTAEQRREMNNRILSTLEVKTLGAFQVARAETFGDMPALRGIYETGGGIALTETLTYYQLERKIESVAVALRACGLEAGDCLCVISENNPNEFILAEACTRIGAHALQWTSAIQSSGLRAADAIQKGKCKLLAMTREEHLKQHIKSAYDNQQHPILTEIVKGEMLIEIGNEIGDIRFPHNIQPHDADRCPPENVDIHDTAFLMFSSGTGGKAPKEIEISHGNMLFQLSVGPAALAQPSGESCLHVLPDIHIYGNTMIRLLGASGQKTTTTDPRILRDHPKEVMATDAYRNINAVPAIHKGMRLGIQKGLYEARQDTSSIKKRIKGFAAWMIEHELGPAMREYARRDIRASKLFGDELYKASERYWSGLLSGHSTILDALSPTRFARKLFKRVMKKSNLHRLALSISGGGAASPYDVAFLATMREGGNGEDEDDTGIAIPQGYGQTESSAGIAVPFLKGNLPAVTAGRLLDGMVAMEYPIHDIGGTGKTGFELCLAGPAIARYRDPEIQRQRIPEGVLHTGDMVRVLSVVHGTRTELIFLFLTRLNRMKKVKGESIMIEPLEDILRGHDYIKEVVVTGDDIDLLGAVIEPSDVLRRVAKHNAGQMRAILTALVPKLTSREVTGQRAWVTRVHLVEKFENTAEFKIITDSQKLIPSAVEEMYARQIQEMWMEKAA